MEFTLKHLYWQHKTCVCSKAQYLNSTGEPFKMPLSPARVTVPRRLTRAAASLVSPPPADWFCSPAPQNQDQQRKFKTFMSNR